MWQYVGFAEREKEESGPVGSNESTTKVYKGIRYWIQRNVLINIDYVFN